MRIFYDEVKNEILVEITKSILSENYEDAKYYIEVLKNFKLAVQ